MHIYIKQSKINIKAIHQKSYSFIHKLCVFSYNNDTDVVNALVLLLVPLTQCREGRKWLKRHYVCLLTVVDVFNEVFDDSDLLSGLGNAGPNKLFGFGCKRAAARLDASVRQFIEAFRKVEQSKSIYCKTIKVRGFEV